MKWKPRKMPLTYWGNGMPRTWTAERLTLEQAVEMPQESFDSAVLFGGAVAEGDLAYIQQTQEANGRVRSRMAETIRAQAERIAELEAK